MEFYSPIRDANYFDVSFRSNKLPKNQPKALGTVETMLTR
jgi:hypothetical protein